MGASAERQPAGEMASYEQMAALLPAVECLVPTGACLRSEAVELVGHKCSLYPFSSIPSFTHTYIHILSIPGEHCVPSSRACGHEAGSPANTAYRLTTC